MSAIILLLSLLCSLVEVHSQTEYPYVSFIGVNLPNHAYVDLTTVGNDGSDLGNTVRCHTNLGTCCTISQGVHRGDWYFPNGSVLANTGGGGDIYIRRGPQVVHLRRRYDATSPSGIYRCDIETDAVHDNDVNTIRGETVYVGLYLPSGGNQFTFLGIHIIIVLYIVLRFEVNHLMCVMYQYYIHQSYMGPHTSIL